MNSVEGGPRATVSRYAEGHTPQRAESRGDRGADRPGADDHRGGAPQRDRFDRRPPSLGLVPLKHVDALRRRQRVRETVFRYSVAELPRGAGQRDPGRPPVRAHQAINPGPGRVHPPDRRSLEIYRHREPDQRVGPHTVRGRERVGGPDAADEVRPARPQVGGDLVATRVTDQDLREARSIHLGPWSLLLSTPRRQVVVPQDAS